jgi:hypothetical protein
MRTVKTRRTRNRWSLALAGVFLAGVAAVAWGFAAYVGLLRLQVRVTDAGSRVEAASRSRAELAANVLHTADAFACLAPDRLTALREATDRASRALLVPRVFDVPEPHREILLAQDDLTAVLEDVWPTLRAAQGAGARVLVEDLESSLERARGSLVERLGELERSIDAYRSRASRFPVSVIAGVTTGDARALLPSRVSGSPGASDAPRSAKTQ